MARQGVALRTAAGAWLVRGATLRARWGRGFGGRGPEGRGRCG